MAGRMHRTAGSKTGTLCGLIRISRTRIPSVISTCVALVFACFIFNFITYVIKIEYLRNMQRRDGKLGQRDILMSLYERLGNLSEDELRLAFHFKWAEMNPPSPPIYLITPTYARLGQKAELTRLSQTLRHIRNLHWIVVEDAGFKTGLVTKLLLNCGIRYTHLNAQTPKVYQWEPGESWHRKPRGVLQRNAGLSWLRTTLEPEKDEGVVYFADDDNTYSLELFEEIRKTEKVSMWPVGLVGGLRYEGPIVKNKKVVGWHSYWNANRTFRMDMAGFSINLKLIFDRPDAVFLNSESPGMLESQILQDLGVTMADLEPRADNCTKVLVWHTRTEKSSIEYEARMLRRYGRQSDLSIEV